MSIAWREFTPWSALAGGMLIGTLFGMVLIPGLYVLFASFEKAKNLDANEHEEDLHAEAPPQVREPKLVA